MNFTKHEKALWDLLLKIGPRQEYYINGYFLTEEEANLELNKQFNLEGLDLTFARLNLCHGEIFKVVEIAGERKIIPKNEVLEKLK